MDTKPRTNEFSPGKLLLLALILALNTSSVVAQKREIPRRRQTTQEDQAKRAKRAKALTLLVETADHARLFDDLYYRAKVQTLAADALWPHDATRARAIFRRAWSAATASDKAEQEESDRESGTASGIDPDFSEARRELLVVVSSRDTRLADALLRELSGEGGDKTRTLQSNISPQQALISRRLELAGELLDSGDARRAAEIALPVVNAGPRIELIVFMLRLRQQNAGEADALYLKLLQRAAANPQTDADDILLLSSHIVSPSLIVSIDDEGALQFRSLPRTRASSGLEQPVPQQTLAAFFSLAGSVLLRPSGPRASMTMHELMAQFYATGRLLPYFESPSSRMASNAPALRARHSELFNWIEAGRREQFSAQFEVKSLTPAGYADPMRSETEQLSRATDSTERRRLALLMVKTAVRNRLWDRARRAAAELEDVTERRAALSLIQVGQIKDIANTYADEKEDDFEGIAKFVRSADVTPSAKAWGLAQAAIIAARRRDDQSALRVSELINEADTNASRVPHGTSARIAAFGIVTLAAARVARPRAWELLQEFVKAANESDDYAGDEVDFDMSIDASAAGVPTLDFGIDADRFRCDSVFATMAELDFDRTLEEANGLNGDVQQAFAVIAICRTVLDKG